MRDALAERLLAAVTKWTPEDLAREGPDLQALAAFKYDEYQQYSPGMRFIESMALWLEQFTTEEDRRCAYEFVKTRLVFLSSAQMSHFVSIAFPDLIRPYLIERAAERAGIPSTSIARVINHGIYRLLLRQTLFFGLSDGSHIDLFRRSNSEISNEQTWATYDIPPDKAKEMRTKLGTDLHRILGKRPTRAETRFRVICLLDDFSASGQSYLRPAKDVENYYKGKIAKVHQSIDEGALRSLVDPSDMYFCVVLYVATEQALEKIGELAQELFEDNPDRFRVLVCQRLPDSIRLCRRTGDAFVDLLERYYDASIMDEHLEIGGDDVVLGFAECGLPLVLSHNTPNNSVYLLWAESSKVRPLFKRVSRHKGEL